MMSRLEKGDLRENAVRKRTGVSLITFRANTARSALKHLATLFCAAKVNEKW